MNLNWLERSIATISPQWAYKRMAWRSAVSAFDGGSTGRLNRNWNPGTEGYDKISQGERTRIRLRAQDLERNSDIAGAILLAFDRNVVGGGMMLQAKIPHNMPGNADGEMNHAIEDLWEEFSKPENIDITGTQSLDEIEETLIRRYIVDGGIIVVKVYTDDKRFPFKIQVRSVDDLNTLNTIVPLENGNRIVEGIELDKYNKPIAYHFKKLDGQTLLPGESVRVKAEDVIFLFKKNSPKQVREVSELATALPRIKDANQFIEAVSIKERVLACLSVFIKRDTPSGGGPGRGISQFATDRKDYSGMTLSPGMIGELNPGDEVQTVIPAGQASNSKEFITTLVRLSSAGIGLSYEAVSRDLSQVNYSSARQGLIEDRKLYKKLQKMLIKKVLTPIYLEFLDVMHLTGQLDFPDYFNKRKEYGAHVWIPPGYNWIDPAKEANANKTALETNQDTLARICAERGEDWRDVLKQRALELKYLKDLMKEDDGEGQAEDADDPDEDES
ncbi:phage portal protein [Paenibacillus albilobatus]|uniref:Phage portal protein n=1 Tax=Paenibacillus albilobatus TaxID=2716884 RepID=A0A920CDT1_9BACL|nr:phage portal protein [Paenibacillus albilobatus]GIO33117.1 phage portal protein [Paenibacillus albilobatus]